MSTNLRTNEKRTHEVCEGTNVLNRTSMPRPCVCSVLGARSTSSLLRPKLSVFCLPFFTPPPHKKKNKTKQKLKHILPYQGNIVIILL